MNIERRLRAFNDMREALLGEMEALDPVALSTKPLAGKWAINEIIEHLVLAERAVFKGLPDPAQLLVNERGLKHQARYLIVMFVLKAGIRVRVPSEAMVPQGNLSLAELRRLWDDNQAWLKSCINHLGPEGMRRAIFEHPVAGPLTVEQAVQMGQIHVEGHIRQIRTIQRLLA